MPTNKPRFSITVDEELLERINQYQQSQNISSQNKAIIELINIGLLKEYGNTPSPQFSREELSVVYAFRFAQNHQREQMLSIAANAHYCRQSKCIQPTTNSVFDAITLLQGYSIADNNTRAAIDALIGQSIEHKLEESGYPYADLDARLRAVISARHQDEASGE